MLNRVTYLCNYIHIHKYRPIYYIPPTLLSRVYITVGTLYSSKYLDVKYYNVLEYIHPVIVTDTTACIESCIHSYTD